MSIRLMQKALTTYFPGRSLFLGIMLIISLLPLLWTVLASLNVIPDNVSTPPTWHSNPSLDRYLEVGNTESHFFVETLNSAILAALTTLTTTTITFLGAYSIARSHFKGRNLLIQCFLILASLPVISFLIPLRSTLDVLHLDDTFLGAMLSEAALYSPLALYIFYGYLNQISPEFEQAAHLDGATTLEILRHVVLPIAASGIAATAIIVFVLSWNQMLIPLVLTPRLATLPNAIIDVFSIQRNLDWTTAAAALVISLLPIGVFVAVAHRFLEQFSLVASQQEG